MIPRKLQLRWKIAQFFEQRWWIAYLGRKDASSYVNWKKQYWNHFLSGLNDLITIRDQGYYADTGCGPAGIFLVLPGSVTAVDPLIGKYTRQFPGIIQSVGNSVAFVNCPLEKWTDKQKFDIIFNLNVINHVNNPAEVLKNLRKMCMEDGVLVLSADEHRWSILHFLFRIFPFDIMHPQQMREEDYSRLLAASGFRVKGSRVLKTEWIFRYRVWVAVPDSG